MAKKTVESLILEQVKDLHDKLDTLRTKDLPEITKKVALIEDRSSRSAKVISGIGGIIAVVVSTAIAFIRG